MRVTKTDRLFIEDADEETVAWLRANGASRVGRGYSLPLRRERELRVATGLKRSSRAPSNASMPQLHPTPFDF